MLRRESAISFLVLTATFFNVFILEFIPLGLLPNARRKVDLIFGTPVSHFQCMYMFIM